MLENDWDDDAMPTKMTDRLETFWHEKILDSELSIILEGGGQWQHNWKFEVS